MIAEGLAELVLLCQ